MTAAAHTSIINPCWRKTGMNAVGSCEVMSALYAINTSYVGNTERPTA